MTYMTNVVLTVIFWEIAYDCHSVCKYFT